MGPLGSLGWSLKVTLEQYEFIVENQIHTESEQRSLRTCSAELTVLDRSRGSGMRSACSWPQSKHGCATETFLLLTLRNDICWENNSTTGPDKSCCLFESETERKKGSAHTLPECISIWMNVTFNDQMVIIPRSLFVFLASYKSSCVTGRIHEALEGFFMDLILSVEKLDLNIKQSLLS